MTLREFFVGRGIVFGIIIVLGLGILGYKYLTMPNVETPIPEVVENTPPVFTWRFEQAETLNLDGNPQTKVFLKATYADGKVEEKLIDTTDGGCNELAEPEADSMPNSVSIQCYYAGLGYKFKITKGEAAYLVLQKEFEEGSPEYNPPEQEYKNVAEFPLS